MTVVIILGAARSGTKFLRSLLGSASNASVVADGSNSVWRIGNENTDHDALDVESVSPQVKETIRRSILANTDSRSTVLIEKTSANTLRPGFVHSIFPHAQYIHLVRDGRAVAESAMRQWKTATHPPSYYVRKFFNLPARAFRSGLQTGLKKLQSPQASRPWGPVYPGMQSDIVELDPISVCARQWNYCVEACTKYIEANMSDRFLEVRYEDLLNSRDVISTICEHVGLPTDAIRAEFERTVKRSDVSRWQTVLSAQDIKKIELQASTSLKRWGYMK